MQNSNTTQQYNIEIDLGHKIVNARKWKAKDRNNFKKLVKNEQDVEGAIKDALVYACLDKEYALTEQELQYVFIELRKQSVSDEFEFEYGCSDCEKINKKIIKIDQINKPVWKAFGEVKTENTTVVFQDIQNVKYYKKNQDDDEINEMAFRVKSINNIETMKFAEIVNFFEEMDIQEFDDIVIEFYEMMFHIDNTIKLTCDCTNEQEFEFDEIPDFFPKTWTR